MSNNLPVKDPDLGHVVPDPGIEEHVERFADVDEGAGNRAYRAILIMLGLVPVLAIAFVVIYFVVPKTMYIDFGWLHASALNVGINCEEDLPMGHRILGDTLRAGLDSWARGAGKSPTRRRRPTSRAPRPQAPGTPQPTGGSSDYPGDYRGIPQVSYAPVPGKDPDPGEVVWTWVPYEEDHAQGKDRPVLLIGRIVQASGTAVMMPLLMTTVMELVPTFTTSA